MLSKIVDLASMDNAYSVMKGFIFIMGLVSLALRVAKLVIAEINVKFVQEVIYQYFSSRVVCLIQIHVFHVVRTAKHVFCYRLPAHHAVKEEG